MRKLFFFFAVLALAFTSCQTESVPQSDELNADFQIEVVDVNTRAPQYDCDGIDANGNYWRVFFSADDGEHKLCSGSPWSCSGLTNQQAADRCSKAQRSVSDTTSVGISLERMSEMYDNYLDAIASNQTSQRLVDEDTGFTVYLIDGTNEVFWWSNTEGLVVDLSNSNNRSLMNCVSACGDGSMNAQECTYFLGNVGPYTTYKYWNGANGWCYTNSQTVATGACK